MWEVTAGELGKAPAAVSDKLEQQKEERAKAIATADEFIASQSRGMESTNN